MSVCTGMVEMSVEWVILMWSRMQGLIPLLPVTWAKSLLTSISHQLKSSKNEFYFTFINFISSVFCFFCYLPPLRSLFFLPKESLTFLGDRYSSNKFPWVLFVRKFNLSIFSSWILFIFYYPKLPSYLKLGSVNSEPSYKSSLGVNSDQCWTHLFLSIASTPYHKSNNDFCEILMCL